MLVYIFYSINGGWGEIILDHYLINEETVLLTGEYDQFGRLCTRVIEAEKTFIVNLKPRQVINNTLLKLGSDFRGVRESSKDILGTVHMCPIKINCNLGIWQIGRASCRERV